MSRWLELLSGLGRALLELLSAELAAVADDLRGTRRELVRVLLVVGAAAAAALLAFAFLSVALVAGLSRVMPLWAAAASVGLVYGVAAAAMAVHARQRLRALEPPTDTVLRHWQDQTEWFRSQVLDAPAPVVAGQVAEEGGE